mgnify:CR=1 FL=1
MLVYVSSSSLERFSGRGIDGPVGAIDILERTSLSCSGVMLYSIVSCVVSCLMS